MRRTLMITLVFTLCEEQVMWNSVLMRLIDDLLALDSIMRFGLVIKGWSGLPPFQYQLTRILALSQSALFPYSHNTPFVIIPRTSILTSGLFLGRSFGTVHLAINHLKNQPSQEGRIHTRIEPLDLEFLDSVIQYFQNTCQRAITELVHFVEPHDLSFIVVDREDYCSRRLNDGIIMLELIAGSLSSWFSEVQLRLEDDRDDLAEGADSGLQSYWDIGS
ncbi:hypothetical protein Tco_1417098 [Tanacetum coccineum]